MSVNSINHPVSPKDAHNVLPRRRFGPKREEVTAEWRNYIMRSLMIDTHHQILFR
jgi:hypothetical protein